MILNCGSCGAELLRVDEGPRTALVGGTLRARAKGKGLEAKCWACGCATSFASDLLFASYRIRPSGEIPEGECLVHYGGDIFAEEEPRPHRTDETSIVAVACSFLTTPAGADSPLPGVIHLHYDESGDTRLLLRMAEAKEETA